jgi:hypothetical protein
MTAAELNPELRKLIDARLESIDRNLSRAQISWSERRSIVGEVETQIFELLARRGPLPTQEDVLAVLASLDPPESYIPEDLRDWPADAPAAGRLPRVEWAQLPKRTAGLVVRFIPVAVGVAALVIANCVVIVIIAASEEVIPWIVTLGALAWLNYAGIRRFRAWSATHQGNFLDELRHSLAAWLLSPNGARAT